MASLGNAALWRELAQLHLVDGVGGLALGAGIGILLVAPLAALLGLLAWLATLKPALTLLLVASAIGEDAQRGPSHAAQARPPLLVLVVGETARSANFALNGHARPTTPELAAQNVVSFRNAWACGTSTAASLPCMFSQLGRSAFESRSINFENLLDVLQRAGLAVLWLDNQSGCKDVCARAGADRGSARRPAVRRW